MGSKDKAPGDSLSARIPAGEAGCSSPQEGAINPCRRRGRRPGGILPARRTRRSPVRSHGFSLWEAPLALPIIEPLSVLHTPRTASGGRPQHPEGDSHEQVAEAFRPRRHRRAVLAMMPVKVNIGDPDAVPARSLRQSEDRTAGTERTWRWRRRAVVRHYLIETKSPLAGDRVLEEEVNRWVDYWWTGGWGLVQRGLKRMGNYEDYIDAELAARDLPHWLRYLPLIDYDHSAVSPAGAAGLWQLMPRTARWLGLEVNSLVDQRFDVYAATPAALDYLVVLHDRFQSWFLALAAYNGGPTRIERAIRRHGGARPRNDALFGHIRDRLPKETRDFIPKILASVRMAGDLSVTEQGAPERAPPKRFDVVRVEGAVSTDVIAEAAGVAEYEIRTLNPHLRIGLVPAGRSTRLHLPVGTGETFLTHFAAIPPGNRSTLREHTVAPGQTLSHIARQYGVWLGALRSVNPEVEPRRIRIGTVLLIPCGKGRCRADPELQPTNSPQPGSQGSGLR